MEVLDAYQALTNTSPHSIYDGATRTVCAVSCPIVLCVHPRVFGQLRALWRAMVLS